MLRLGHIIYSNCFPVHSRFLDAPRRGDPALVAGIPSELNRMLREGGLDVAPSSSIEYAQNSDRYLILPDLVIGSRGAVQSIMLLADGDPSGLDGQKVAIPTASATSVVLLKILLQVRWKVKADFHWFDQRTDDPFASGAAAALFIGDVALQKGLFVDKPVRLDLGKEWWEETGLPFAFALWQAGSAHGTAELGALQRDLTESREYGESKRSYLAHRYADHFGMPGDDLDRYWSGLKYRLDEPMIEGLETYYRLAAEIGELTRAPELRWAG